MRYRFEFVNDDGSVGSVVVEADNPREASEQARQLAEPGEQIAPANLQDGDDAQTPGVRA